MGVDPQHPALHQGLGNTTAMLRFLWQSRDVHDHKEEERPPLVLTLCPVRALQGWFWAWGCSFSLHPAHAHPAAELGLSCTQKHTPAIAALFFI